MPVNKDTNLIYTFLFMKNKKIKKPLNKLPDPHAPKWSSSGKIASGWQ